MIEPDEEKAIELFKLAAKRGHGNANHILYIADKKNNIGNLLKALEVGYASAFDSLGQNFS